MPYWIELNQLRSIKDLETFDEMTTFKKMKNYRPTTAGSNQRAKTPVNDDQTQLVILFYLYVSSLFLTSLKFLEISLQSVHKSFKDTDRTLR